MGHHTRQLLHWARGVALLVAVGSIVAAVNWHRIWRSFALDGAGQDPPTANVTAVEAQATFQQWVLVALIGLAVAVASCVFPVARAGDPDRDEADAVAA